MKWRIDDVPIFRAVVDQGGITAAANALGMPKSTVSKAVSRLEQDLGVRLLDRNSRKLRVTSEGQTFFGQSQLIMEQVDEADALMAQLTSTPRGRLTIAVPGAFCQEILAPHLPIFRQRCPEVSLELVLSSTPVDIIGNQFDMAIVIGEQPDSELTQKTLLSGRLVWVAAPKFLAVLPNTISDPLPHVAICETRYALRRLPVNIGGEPKTLDLSKGVVRVNDPLSVRAAVLQGAGVAVLPERYCLEHLEDGTLIEVCKHISFDISASVLSVIFPTRRLMSARHREFLNFLEQVCRDSASSRSLSQR